MPGGAEQHQLSETDVRAMVRLLADVAITQGGVLAQKRRLIEGIAELTGADVWMWNVVRNAPGEAPVAVSLLHNLTEAQLTAIAEHNYKHPNNEENDAYLAMNQTRRHWTRQTDEFMPQCEQQEASTRWAWRKHVGTDGNAILTSYPVPGESDLISMIGLHRLQGRDPFGAREAKLLHILTSEVGWLHELSVPEADPKDVAVLPPRLQTVLTMLIDGQAPKRIAYHLELSEHTVRGYVKDVYKHFDVGSRAELMRRFMVGDGGDIA